MQYLTGKPFKVSMMANSNEEKCKCGKIVVTGITTKEGLMCLECYRKHKETINAQVR